MDQQQAAFDKQKADNGKSATFAWIGIGIYLFATTSNANFLSWQAAVYFIVGMFFAAIVFGTLAYLLQRNLARLLAQTLPERSGGIAVTAASLGVLIFLAELVAIYFVANFTITELLFGS